MSKQIASFALFVILAASLAVASSAQPLRAQVSGIKPVTPVEKVLPKHFVGKVLAVNQPSQTFTLVTNSQNFVVATSDKTKFVSFLGNKKTENFKALRADAKVTIVGTLRGSTIEAKLVAQIKEKTSKRHAGHGKIVSLSATTITVEPSTKKGTTSSLDVSSSTVYTKKVGTKISRVNLIDLQVGDRIAYVGTLDDKSTLTAKLVHVIP